jgi:hypothetical protein
MQHAAYQLFSCTSDYLYTCLKRKYFSFAYATLWLCNSNPLGDRLKCVLRQSPFLARRTMGNMFRSIQSVDTAYSMPSMRLHCPKIDVCERGCARHRTDPGCLRKGVRSCLMVSIKRPPFTQIVHELHPTTPSPPHWVRKYLSGVRASA